KVGDVVEIYHNPKPPKSKRLLIQVSSTTPMKGVSELSILNNIASLFGLEARKEVVVRKIRNEEEAVIDFIELSFKDQYLSRSDMFRFTLHLQNQSAYIKKHFQW